MRDVFLVAQYRGDDMEFQGIFSTEEKAIEACRDSRDVYVKYVLDEELPREQVYKPWICPGQKLVCKDGKTWEPIDEVL